MTRVILLEQLKAFTEASVKDIIMPVSMQKGDSEQAYRAAEVYKMRLPDGNAAKKKAPYIIHQIITGSDEQPEGNPVTSRAVIRSIFTVYNNDEQEGAMMLLNLIERLRIDLMKSVVIGEQFILDLQSGIEYLIYPDNTAPYFSGEMVSVWEIPAVKREVVL